MTPPDLPSQTVPEQSVSDPMAAAESGIGPAADVVAQAWAELLGARPARTTDDFFAVGGDSLKALRLVAAIRDRAGVAIPFRAVFDNSTYGELARTVAREWPADGTAV